MLAELQALLFAQNHSITVQQENDSDSESSLPLMQLALSAAALSAFILRRPIQRYLEQGIELGRYGLLRWEIYRMLPAWEGLLEHAKVATPEPGGSESNDIIRKMTAQLEPVAARMVAEVFERYASRGPTLELGSNRLDEQGNSYLARLLPKKYRDQLEFSDHLQETVDSESQKTRRPYHCLDATRLQEKLPAGSQTNVVAINVLDTISRSKLGDVAAGIYHSLRNLGRVIILSDLPFDPHPLFEKLSTEDDFLFPYKGDELGVVKIHKKALLQAAQSFGEEFSQFIQKLVALPQNQSTYLCLLSIKYNTGLCSVLERICRPEEYERVEHTRSYTDDLNKVFESHGGFEIEKSEYSKAGGILSGAYVEGKPINVIGSDLRKPDLFYYGLDMALKQNTIRIETVFHVMVARKCRTIGVGGVTPLPKIESSRMAPLSAPQ